MENLGCLPVIFAQRGPLQAWQIRKLRKTGSFYFVARSKPLRNF